MLMILVSILKCSYIIEGPNVSTSRANENTENYCPRCDVTCERSESEMQK